MDYKKEFEKLLDVSEQAIQGVDFENRKVLGFAGLGILQGAVLSYRNLQQQGSTDGITTWVCPDCSEIYEAYQKHTLCIICGNSAPD